MEQFTILAKFKGENGSLGYTHNIDYVLNFFIQVINRKPHICICRTDGSDGFCPYSSMKAFLANWEVIQ